MPENIQDKLISAYDYKEYDIAYPVIITRWKIMQVNGLDKRYLQVYFQKISDTVKALKFNVKCYSDIGEVENLTDISFQEIDKNDLEFSKVVPLKSEINKVEVNIIQCLSIDGSAIEKQHKTIVVNTFKPFNEEDSEAGKRLLPNAKGYPIDNVSHWYCACGVLYSSDTKRCEKCNKSKNEIFTLITSENMQEARIKESYDIKKHNDKLKINGVFIFALGILTLLTLFIPILSVNEVNVVVFGFKFSTDYVRLTTNWDSTIYFSTIQMVFSICTMIFGILMIFFFNDKHIKISNKKIKKISISFSIICVLLMLAYLVISCVIYSQNKYLVATGAVKYKFEESLWNNSYDLIYDVHMYSWIGPVLGFIVYICYIVFFFFYDQIYNKLKTALKKEFIHKENVNDC